MVTAATARVTAEERAEIIELYARYAWGLDLADADMLLSAFAEDAEQCFLTSGTNAARSGWMVGSPPRRRNSSMAIRRLHCAIQRSATEGSRLPLWPWFE